MTNVPAHILALPALLQEVALTAGEPAALNLARTYGGTRLYIPTSVNEDHRLAKALGLGPARALVKALGGEEHLIPLGPYAFGPQRARVIDEMTKKGEPAAVIARAVGCTERSVYRRREISGGAPSDQPDLFKNDETVPSR